jgi:SecD/SecF fusion protein
VEKALPAAPAEGEKPRVDLLPQEGNLPAPVAVSLTKAQAESRKAVVDALRQSIGIVNSLRDDVVELFGSQLAKEPFENERPATENARDPFYGGKTVTVRLQDPAPAGAVEGVLKEVFPAASYPSTKDLFRVEAPSDAPVTAVNLTLAPAAWSRFEEIKTAFKAASVRPSPPFVLSKGPFQKEATVGSAVASDLQESAIIATVLSWVVMIIYLAVRFRTWLHGIAAVVALVHDVLCSIGAIALCGLLVPKSWGLNFEFGLQTVAAALTIIGFSVNDTIVIFDRIRENMPLMRREPFRKIIDVSVNQTLSRTILTSLTVFFTVVLLYTITMRSAGGIAEFAFPMIVGVLVGTYSSVYIAAPFLILGKREGEDARPKPAGAAS